MRSRRSWALALASAALLAAAVVPIAGCGSSQVTTIPILPTYAAMLAGKPTVLGGIPTDPGTFDPAYATPAGKDPWTVTEVGKAPWLPRCTVQIGTTAVIVGATPSPTTTRGKDVRPFVATSDSGGAYKVQDLTEVFGGLSARLHGVCAADLEGEPMVIAVGGAEAAKGATVGNPTGTDPVVIMSADSGKTWSEPVKLPRPPGTVSAEAYSIVKAGEDTEYPGLIVAGTAWLGGTSDNAVAVVWHTWNGTDWQVLSNDLFQRADRQTGAFFVTADDSMIVVAGWGDTAGGPDASDPVQRATFEWSIAKGGEWEVADDSKNLDSGKSSIPTALYSRPSGGFLAARQVYATGSDHWTPGAPPESEGRTVRLSASSDGTAWNDVSSAIKGLEEAALLDGIVEDAGTVDAAAVSADGHGKVFTVKSGQLR